MAIEPQEEQTIELRKPLKLGESTYAELTLTEPTAGQLEKATANSNPTSVLITLISLVAKVPRKAVEGMSQRDMEACSNFFGQFSSGSPLTGDETLPP